jgi:hypothetical protein
MQAIQNVSVARRILNYGIPVLLIIFSIGLALSSFAKQHSELYTAVTYDLILTTPLLFYFLSKRKVSKFAIGLFVSAGIIAAYFVIPDSEKLHFNLIRFLLLPLIELSIFGSIIYFTYKTVNEFKTNSKGNTDYLVAFQDSGVKAFKSKLVGKLFGAELAMIHYAFFNWKSTTKSKNEFNYHNENGTLSLLAGVMMVIVFETIGAHFLIAKWSSSAAWILTILSIYTFVMLFAHLKAIMKRPHQLNNDSIDLKLGLFGTAKIPLDQIEKIEFTSNISDEVQDEACQFTPLGSMESFNTVLYLKDKIDCEFIYGIKRKYKTILISLDNKVAFEEQLMERGFNI